MEEQKIAKIDIILFVINLETANLQIQLVDSCAKYNELYYATCSKKESHQQNKLTRERYLLKDVFRQTLLELINDEDWSVLRNAITLLQRTSLHQTQLRKRHEELKSSLEAITTQLIKRRHESEAKLRHCDLNTALLKDIIKDTMMNTAMRLNYVDKWLLARAESVDLEHREEINIPPSTDCEKRVHQQVSKIYELQIKESQESLEYWKCRYIKDIVDINERLKTKSKKFKEAVDRRTELHKLYDLHAGEMRAWLSFKQERSARLAREERSRLAATRIQAWWRGVMVRRCIGVFKQLKNAKKPQTKVKKK
ncbi:unnamed protein product [Pieris macdunnoughi]|uniref:Dynein regulatory complex protein 9 n=1 Tax=Pieris macdunnoughi TaxID=345717 RepID=A0A821TYB4_9NEOP|nr:unnamed protein product [Pieris macdunnoughi]